MVSCPSPQGGVTRTVGAFNFIRRISFPTMLEVLSIFCTLALLSTFVALPSAGAGLYTIFSFTVFVMIASTLLGELANGLVILRKDPVLNFRRLMGLELLCWWTLPISIPVSTLLGVWFGSGPLWVDGLLLSLALSLPLRSLSMLAVSSLHLWRKVLSAAIVPIILVSSFAYISPMVGIGSGTNVVAALGTLIVGVILSTVSVYWFVHGVEDASPQIGASPMELFRAFLQHWLKNEPGPLERRLTALGKKGQVETSTLAFFDQHNTAKACFIVSTFHPGPYRDLGSGGLPYTIKSEVESKIGGIAVVPHGISNHEFNIISREDIGTLLRQTRAQYPRHSTSRTATRFIRVEVEGAKASAQLFGSKVLVTLTLAPKDMEDIPVEVLSSIQAAASRLGVVALAVDAHNSLSTQTALTRNQAQGLAQAAIKALTLASTAPQEFYEVGAASHPLTEFSLEEGIGPGGLSIVVVETQGQLSAYLTIDGNNMQSGFRDTILNALTEEGVSEAEVTTTDTHLVTGLVPSSLGYHPVGEGVDKQLFIGKIRETLREAIANMQKSSSGFSTFNLDLRVLGSEAFGSITSFIGRIASRIGQFIFRLELATFLVALALLAFL